MAAALLALGWFTMVAFLGVRGRLIPNRVQKTESKHRLPESVATGHPK
jgi:hypothetical protein